MEKIQGKESGASEVSGGHVMTAQAEGDFFKEDNQEAPMGNVFMESWKMQKPQTEFPEPMSRRDYFAAAAMQGYCARTDVMLTRMDIALFSLHIADHMIALLDDPNNSV